MAGPTRVALALGGGGARGYAHIGVIAELEARGCEIVTVAGTSMGALVGGLYAAGQLGPYTDWARGLTQRDVLRLLDPSLKAPGAIRGERILRRVTELLDGAVIEELAIPFTAVATDLLAGKEVWFQRGPVDAAIRASIALPSVFTPVVLNGRLLADGGLMNPIPVAATTAATADLIVGVVLAEEHPTSSTFAPVQESTAAEKGATADDVVDAREADGRLADSDLRRWLTSWFTGDRQTSPIDAGEEALEHLDEGLFGNLPPNLRTRDVMELSLHALQRVVTRFRLASYPPDLLITVPRAACRTLDFHRAAEMIDLGQRRASEALDGRSLPVR